MFDSPVLDKGKATFVGKKNVYSEYEGKRSLECLKLNQLIYNDSNWFKHNAFTWNTDASIVLDASAHYIIS